MKSNLNLIFAAIFMIGFFFFWDSFVMSRYNTRPKPAAPAAATLAPTPVLNEKVSTTPHPVAAQANPKEETLTILETPEVKVSWLSKGARVVSWQVKERDHWIEMVVPENKRVVSPLETFSDVNFLAQKKSDTHVIFTATLPNGLGCKKDFQLLAQPPFHKLTVTFSNPTKHEIPLKAELPLGNGVDKHQVGTPYDPKQEDLVLAETRAVGLATQVKTWRPGFIYNRKLNLVDQGPFKWVGVDDNHFMLAFLSADEKPIGPVKVMADRVHPPQLIIPLEGSLAAGSLQQSSYLVYAGPKDYDDLKKLGHDLDQAVNFGFFGFISKALLRALIFFESITHNYGWAIIILTFFIQLLVFPLTRKNLQHAARMKDLQPQLKQLQAQFKSDPKRLQVETFNLYKRNGMKFMGMEGCFPIMLQIPVFFAFYSTLRVAYELRGAPWIFWIKDLGAHDPFYVLPVLMGGGMFLQQKATAAPADPAQAKIMMFMPIMFTFMFLKLPSGLVLYWVVNSLTTIVIQKLLAARKNTPPQLTVS